MKSEQASLLASRIKGGGEGGGAEEQEEEKVIKLVHIS